MHAREIRICPELFYTLYTQEDKNPYTTNSISENHVFICVFHHPYLEPIAMAFPLNNPLSINRYEAAGRVERAAEHDFQLEGP